MSLFAAYEQVFGVHPRALTILKRSIEVTDVVSFVGARFDSNEPQRDAGEAIGIRPLISHHHFNPYALFSDHKPESISNRALALLFAHDGLVLSDPTVEIATLLHAGQKTQALLRFREITEGLAEIEPLVDRGLLEFTPYRPKTTEDVRSQVLANFGIDPVMTVFANFDQAAIDAKRFETLGGTSYVRQAATLFSRMGLEPPTHRNVEEARNGINVLWQALLHLSWSVSVCSADPSADLTLHSELEELLFSILVAEDLNLVDSTTAGHERTRHFERLATGSLPNMKTLSLSIPDALALRQDDTFEAFRDGLHGALTAFDATLVPLASPLAAERAREDFQRQMRTLSSQLEAATKRASFSDLVRDGSLACGIATVSLIDPLASIPLAAVSTLFAWLQGRRRTDGRAIAVRYATTLGAESGRRRGVR